MREYLREVPHSSFSIDLTRSHIVVRAKTSTVHRIVFPASSPFQVRQQPDPQAACATSASSRLNLALLDLRLSPRPGIRRHEEAAPGGVGGHRHVQFSSWAVPRLYSPVTPDASVLFPVFLKGRMMGRVACAGRRQFARSAKQSGSSRAAQLLRWQPLAHRVI